MTTIGGAKTWPSSLRRREAIRATTPATLFARSSCSPALWSTRSRPAAPRRLSKPRGSRSNFGSSSSSTVPAFTAGNISRSSCERSSFRAASRDRCRSRHRSPPLRRAFLWKKPRHRTRLSPRLFESSRCRRLPRNEADVAALLDWCSSGRAAAIPYGGIECRRRRRAAVRRSLCRGGVDRPVAARSRARDRPRLADGPHTGRRAGRRGSRISMYPRSPGSESAAACALPSRRIML